MRPSLPVAPLLVASLFLLAAPPFARRARAQATTAGSSAATPIQDNSFLVEEAYNQGRGIVQHVSTFARNAGGGWSYTFTQEWPAPDQRHQLSYTLPVARADRAAGGRSGVGDVALNYRHQVGRIEGARTAFAPRLTVLLPTGAAGRGLGAGGAGVQVNLPLSVELPASLVVHSNAGLTYTPRARDAAGDRAGTDAVTLAQSLVWLAHPRLNLLLEGLWTRAQSVDGPRHTAWESDAVLAPGLRGAIDFRSGLQIVPGLAFPIGVGPGRGERSVFLYLSLEHPFARQGP